MLRKLCIAGILLGGLVVGIPRSEAQDTKSGPQEPLQPMPPAGVGGSTPTAKPAATGSPMTQEETVVPDSRPLAGAQDLTLGSTPSGHNLLLPSFGVTTQAQTNPYNARQANSPDVLSATFLTGRLAINRTSGRSQLLFDYLAGGMFSKDLNQGNSVIQSLGFSDTISWGRWSQMFGDQLSYTSQSPFGFGGLGGLNNLGVSLGNAGGSSPGFRPNFVPNQSILIYGEPQISNAVIAQTGYALSHRSSLTFVGSYGILDFVNGGFQDSSNASFQAGYNYSLSRKDSISSFYHFSTFMFSGVSQRIQTHSVQLSYARQITGRLSFQISAGPQVDIFRSAAVGPGTVADWTLTGALNYQLRSKKNGMSISFDRLMTGGSGVLPGAETDVAQGTLTHGFNRDWDGAVSVGYSRNDAFQQTIRKGNTISPQAWFATAQVSRHFVRYGRLFIAYSASGQSSLASICTLPACRVSSLSSTVSIGYNWGLRPIVLE